MGAEEKRHLRTFARNLCAALAAHRMRVSFRTAMERYTPAEADESWYWFAESLKAAAWYIRRFGDCKPEWFVFPAGKGQPNDPTRPVTTLRTAWTKVRDKAKVVGRWHDNRHTLVTELAESGAGDEVIMSIAGHVSRAMLSRYSHVRMEAKRRALDEIAARQRAFDDKRKSEAEQQQQSPVASQSAIIQ
jgi:hypothetical protein